MKPASHLEEGLIAEASGSARRRPRLLVVDDQPLNIQVLYQVFCADHQILMATSGEQALALCEKEQPDLILLDVMMPGLDGYAVCEQLKAAESTRQIPVIFVTAHNDESAEARGLDAGAVDFISKPINPKIVRARVKTHLTLKAQSDLLREWVYIDGLTGVHNRRFFDERLASECGRAARSGAPLGVMLLDVDFFKRYNDGYGHQAGDVCLRRIADALKSGLRRPADLVARYGGEEFACILPETDFDGAMNIARSLEQCVREMNIAHEHSDAAPVVTISLGVAGGAGNAPVNAGALLAEADAQLYKAKSAGRGRAHGGLMNFDA